MAGTLLGAWIWTAVTVLVVGCLWRIARYARTPMHLRWDLYPVAHEPRRDHGGSYLEEPEWWTRPRRRDLLGELGVMAREILLLEGVRERNRRVWRGSFPFHWGLYLLVATSLGLAMVVAGVAWPGWPVVLRATGGLGGALLAVGAAILLVLRSTDASLRRYTTPADRLNLSLLAVVGALSAVVALDPGMGSVAETVRAALRLRAVEAPPVLLLQMALAGLFVVYFPFTRMIHMIAKYFLYHEVRWDDAPADERSARRLRRALQYGIAWSADHVRGGRTWGEVVTTVPNHGKGGDDA